MGLVQDFYIKAHLAKGKLPREIIHWLADQGAPAEDECLFSTIAYGDRWFASTPYHPAEGDTFVRFRFKDAPLAIMFKLTFGGF